MATSTGVPEGVTIRNAGTEPSTQYPATVTQAGALVVAVTSSAGSGISITNRSGTLTTGSTSQQVMAANPSRSYLLVQNPVAATETLFVAAGYTATTVSGQQLALAPGGTWIAQGPSTPTDAINVNAATSAHVFTAWEG